VTARAASRAGHIPVRTSARWLALREPADAVARSTELVSELRSGLPADRPLRIYDLGCGSGSMGRWLAPQLPGPQHWVACDRDPDLLARTVAEPPPAALDGAAVTVEARRVEFADLRADAAADADLIVAAAVLDVLDGNELQRLVRCCVGAGCPALLTLSVTGQVRLDPHDRWDATLGQAFNAHQRRAGATSPLLGPDAAGVAIAAFEARGFKVLQRQSPWRLGADQGELIEQWLAGWLAAATECRPDLAEITESQLTRRRAEIGAGELRVKVGHVDLLARPR
jgi:trans-aconitate methyltransferase